MDLPNYLCDDVKGIANRAAPVPAGRPLVERINNRTDQRSSGRWGPRAVSGTTRAYP